MADKEKEWSPSSPSGGKRQARKSRTRQFFEETEKTEIEVKAPVRRKSRVLKFLNESIGSVAELEGSENVKTEKRKSRVRGWTNERSGSNPDATSMLEQAKASKSRRALDMAEKLSVVDVAVTDIREKKWTPNWTVTEEDQEFTNSVSIVPDGTWGRRLSATEIEPINIDKAPADGALNAKAFITGRREGPRRVRRMAARLNQVDRELLAHKVDQNVKDQKKMAIAKDKEMIRSFKPSRFGRRLSMTESDQPVNAAKLAATGRFDSSRVRQMAKRLVEVDTNVQAGNAVSNARSHDPAPRKSKGARGGAGRTKDIVARLAELDVEVAREVNEDSTDPRAENFTPIADGDWGRRLSTKPAEHEKADPRSKHVKPVPDGQWGRKLSVQERKDESKSQLLKTRKFGSRRAQDMAKRLYELEQDIISEVDAELADPRAQKLVKIPDGEWGRRLSDTEGSDDGPDPRSSYIKKVPDGRWGRKLSTKAESETKDTISDLLSTRKFGSKRAQKMAERYQELEEEVDRTVDAEAVDPKLASLRRTPDGEWGRKLSTPKNMAENEIGILAATRMYGSKRANEHAARLLQDGTMNWGRRLSEENIDVAEEDETREGRRSVWGARLSQPANEDFSATISDLAAEKAPTKPALNNDLDLIKVLKDNGLGQFAGAFEERSIYTVEEALGLQMRDFRAMGVKKYSDRERLQEIVRKATAKPKKIMLCYANGGSGRTSARFSKTLGSIRLNYGKQLVDSSGMNVQQVVEAMQDTDMVVLVLTREFFNGNSAGRAAAIVGAIKKEIPIVTAYVSGATTLGRTRSNRKLLSQISSMLRELPEESLDQFSSNNISHDEVFSAAERVSKKMKVSVDNVLNTIEREYVKLR